jgi:hypothetical protein
LGEALDLRQLFEAGLLQAAVVSRPIEGMPKHASRFEQLYRVVRPGDVSSALPSTDAAFER